MKRKDLVNVLKALKNYKIDRDHNDKLLITFHGDMISFDRKSYGIYMHTEFDNEFEADRSIVVSFKELLDIVNSMNGGDLLFDGKGDLLTITDGDTLITLKTIDTPDKLPKVDIKEQEAFDKSFTIPSKTLLEAFNKIDFNMTSDKDYRNLHGLYFEKQEDGTLNVVGVDGYRMGLTKIKEFTTSDDEIFGVFITYETTKTLKALIKSKSCDDITFKYGKTNDGVKWAVIECGTLKIYENTDLEFPNYKHVIPDTFQDVVKLLRKPVLETLKRMVKINKGYQEPCKIKMEFNHVNFSLKNPQAELSQSFTADITGDDLLMGFNPALLKDVFQNYKVDEIIMKFQGENKPVVITSDDDPDTFYIVMPVRL